MPWCTYCGKLISPEQAQHNNNYCQRCAREGILKTSGWLFVWIFIILGWGIFGFLGGSWVSQNWFHLPGSQFSFNFAIIILLSYVAVSCVILYIPLMKWIESRNIRNYRREVGIDSDK